MREPTDDLTVGLGKLRWGDSRAEVERAYPDARPTPERRLVNPETGEPFVIPAGLLIGVFERPHPHATLSASIQFDARGLAEISLFADEADDAPEEALADSGWDEVIEACVVSLSMRLGFGPHAPVSDDDEEQVWTVRGVRVSLSLEPGELSLTLSRES